MPIRLQDRPIAITGASSGIGRATAVACARAGMPVALAARRADRLEAVAREIRELGGRALPMVTDVTSEASCEAFIEGAAREFGSVYAVFANAGYGADAAILDMTDQELRAIFDTNFFGSLNVIRPAVRRLLENAGRPRGHVLLCSSCVARFALPNLAAYAGTKAAQAQVASSMRVELRPEGIHVSSVHPIGVRTEFFERTRRTARTESSPHRAPGAFTQSAEFVASRVVACLRRPRPEVWTGARGALTRLTAGAFVASPRFADLIARASLPRK